MTMRKKMVESKVGGSESLASVLASLGLSEKPDFIEWTNTVDHRIHWAVRVLQYSGFEPVSAYAFDHYICGPFSFALEHELEGLDWNCLTSAAEIDDPRMALVRDAILKGDDFLEALAITVGMIEDNPGISRKDTLWMVVGLRPALEDEAIAAYEFAEVKIWSK